jgi:hypothetical protein
LTADGYAEPLEHNSVDSSSQIESPVPAGLSLHVSLLDDTSFDRANFSHYLDPKVVEKPLKPNAIIQAGFRTIRLLDETRH